MDTAREIFGNPEEAGRFMMENHCTIYLRHLCSFIGTPESCKFHREEYGKQCFWMTPVYHTCHDGARCECPQAQGEAWTELIRKESTHG